MRDIKNYIDNNTADECCIFFARGKDEKEEGIVKFGSGFRIKAKAFGARLFDNDGFGSKANTKTLLKLLNEYKPDVVHLHCLHGYYINVQMLFDYLKLHSNIKVVWTMHDTWAFTGHCCFFSRCNCEKWIDGCCECPMKHEYPKSIFMDNSRKNYSNKKRIFTSLAKEQLRIVVPSNWLAELVNRSFLKQYDVSCIYNGIDLNKFKKTEAIEDRGKTLLGVASVWDERKGLNKFLELSEELKESYKIKLVGKIDNKSAIPEYIDYVERTENTDELVKIYNESAILFNPSSDDNYPTVNIEAQVCGCKVLAFDVGGIKETNLGNLYITDDKQPLKEQIDRVELLETKQIDLEKASKDRMSREYYVILKMAKNITN